jgi:hypothetical protein
MVDKKQSNRVICEGGLDSTQNYLFLSANKPGAATRLINYEAGLSGGYRRINGYTAYDETYAEVGVGGVAQGKILGLMMFENTVTGSTEIYAARQQVADATQYNLYKYEFGTGWVSVTTGLTHYFSSGGSEVDKVRWDQGNDGTNNYLAFVDGVNKATLFNGTNWVFIDSAGTGANFANAGGAQAIDAPTLVGFFENHLWIAGDVRNEIRGVMAHSAPNAFFDWTSASGAGQVIAGHNIVQFKSFRSNLYVFGSNSIKRIFVEASEFLIKDVTVNIGLVNPDVVFEIGGTLLFLAPDGFRPIAGTDKIGDVQIETVSKPVHRLVQQRLVNSAGLNMNAVVIRGKSQFRVFFGDDNTDADGSKGIIGGLRTADQQTGWEFGELLGIRASCCTSRYVNGVEIVLHGDFDGVVYRQERGNDLNGSAMTSVYSTPYLDLGDTEVRKVFEKVTVFANGEGNVDLNLNISYDWGKEEIANPQNYIIELEADQPIYGDSTYTYDDPATVYGGILTPIGVTNIEGSFFSTRLTFSASGTEAPHTIHALVIEYAVKGRR